MNCITCGGDIVGRHFNAKYCLSCREKKDNQLPPKKLRPKRSCCECERDITNEHRLAKRCAVCRTLVMTGKCNFLTPQGASARIVSFAVQGGILPRLSDIHVDCVDCGKRATEYDHRDYLKPLDVDPVCRKCNVNRGPAKNALSTQTIKNLQSKKIVHLLEALK